MCFSTPDIPPAPPPPAAPPPPITPTAVQPASEGTGNNGLDNKRKGTSSLRIDKASSNPGGGSGLNIPQ